MNVDYLHWHSPILGQKFEMKVFGDKGRALCVFPSSEGHFWDFEDNGMVEVCRPWIEKDRLQVFCIDGRDWESWSNTSIAPHDRATRHEVWEKAVVEEAMPRLREVNKLTSREMIVTGCSGGAYHAANFMFKHPDLCDSAILLSGVYSTKYFRTDHVDDYDYADPLIYFNNPLHYLKDLHDNWFLSKLRDSRIIICCGQGAYEQDCLEESYALSRELRAKLIEHWLDIWGQDVNHDWPWWRRQLPYFLGKLEV